MILLISSKKVTEAGPDIDATAGNATISFNGKAAGNNTFTNSGDYYFNLQNYAQSGTSYEMIDIGNGFYTIQAT